MADTAPNETDETVVDNDTGAATNGATAGVQTLKDNVIKFANDAGDKAKAAAEDGKTPRGRRARRTRRRCCSDAAGTVDEKVGDQYGQYARSAADAVAEFLASRCSRNRSTT